MFAAIVKALARGDEVAVMGFGRFARTERAAREGHNPRTGEPMAIGPSSGVSLRADKAPNDALK